MSDALGNTKKNFITEGVVRENILRGSDLETGTYVVMKNDWIENVTEVINCANCMYYVEPEWCAFFNFEVPEDGFCHNAEWAEEEDVKEEEAADVAYV